MEYVTGVVEEMIHFWRWGFRFRLGRLGGGLFIHDGFEFSPWRFEYFNLPGAGACLNGTIDLAIGPLILVWVK